MSVKEWLLAHQQDERERFYVGRAAMWAWSVTAVAALVLAWIELAADRVDSAMNMIMPLSFGVIVFFGYLVLKKATR
jgi:hypothetical protein